jgi:hypothetical protein
VEPIFKIILRKRVNGMDKVVLERVKKFMVDNKISCEETIYQSDLVIENDYEFIADLFNIVESELPIKNED